MNIIKFGLFTEGTVKFFRRSHFYDKKSVTTSTIHRRPTNQNKEVEGFERQPNLGQLPGREFSLLSNSKIPGQKELRFKKFGVVLILFLRGQSQKHCWPEKNVWKNYENQENEAKSASGIYPVVKVYHNSSSSMNWIENGFKSTH